MSICVLRGRSTVAVEPAELTLILLPHAGGSAGSFVPLLPHLPESWRILVPELPARATAPKQPVCPSIESAVDSFAGDLAGELSGPYAVFGHCLGALIAFELVHELAKRGHQPLWTGVSGSPAPQLVVSEPANGRPEDWTRDQYVDYMRWLGNTPEALWNNTVLADRMIAALRNDLIVNHGYRYGGHAPLTSPLSVMRGDSDPLVSAEEMRAWADHAGATDFRTWPGDHFYVFDRAPEVSARIVGAIAEAAAQTDMMGSR
ncbi:thioesterase II family protein [Streptomyces sp. DSM 41634]|uniref:thioesterase II family protein n=1 Tax=Streptomyces sp. DSM 41634 TaxID=3448656 RepID=UPI0028849721|nr:thioesterase domain-containing protein [Streptomyces sp. DSM 41633]